MHRGCSVVAGLEQPDHARAACPTGQAACAVRLASPPAGAPAAGSAPRSRTARHATRRASATGSAPGCSAPQRPHSMLSVAVAASASSSVSSSSSAAAAPRRAAARPGGHRGSRASVNRSPSACRSMVPARCTAPQRLQQPNSKTAAVAVRADLVTGERHVRACLRQAGEGALRGPREQVVPSRQHRGPGARRASALPASPWRPGRPRRPVAARRGRPHGPGR